MSQSDRPEDVVGRFLGENLSCEIETRPFDRDSGTVFAPAREEYGELHVEERLLTESDTDELVGRLRKEGIDQLLRRGERVRMRAVSTEILPRTPVRD